MKSDPCLLLLAYLWGAVPKWGRAVAVAARQGVSWGLAGFWRMLIHCWLPEWFARRRWQLAEWRRERRRERATKDYITKRPGRIISVSVKIRCSWCDEINDRKEKFCPQNEYILLCGHCADLPRAECDCPRCTVGKVLLKQFRRERQAVEGLIGAANALIAEHDRNHEVSAAAVLSLSQAVEEASDAYDLPTEITTVWKMPDGKKRRPNNAKLS